VFGWHLDILEDRVYGTNDLALLAIDANFRVDVELRRTGHRMNACHGADFNAGAVIGTQAGNHVRHWFSFRSL
jgi:hypothetical protein